MTTTIAASRDAKLNPVTPDVLAKWRDAGDAALIDVREDFERAAEWIPGATQIPLGELDADAIRERHHDQRVVFYCRSGKRSLDAARRYQHDDKPAFYLAGGIEAWKAARLPVERGIGAGRMDVMRQTQIVIGTFVLTGVLLGAFVSPWFLILSGFMGAGLIFAGASGSCGMALMIAKLPWNRVAGCPTK